jgi:hypothetical protein
MGMPRLPRFGFVPHWSRKRPLFGNASVCFVHDKASRFDNQLGQQKPRPTPASEVRVRASGRKTV